MRTLKNSVVPGSPNLEHSRSPAAHRVAQFARQSDLFFAHFEHRVRLPLPLDWDSESGASPDWVAGVLPEPKYQAFRHDLLVASFHPGHRAKWTAHELCHALVGFAYRPGATGLFHALGAWLSELLPVALWYFFDEAGLTRCEKHSEQGALFQAQCDDCEEAAKQGARKPLPADKKFIREGLAFIDRELRAVRHSKRIGLPQGTRFGTVDLASDGLTYARAHGARLRAPEMERYVAQFFAPDQGHHASLEALEARVVEVRDALFKGAELRPWAATRWDYTAQDLGYRLLTLRATRSGEMARSLDALIDALAKKRTKQGVARLMEAYGALAASTKRSREALPSKEDMFAVGYGLEAQPGVSLRQLDAGVRSACPGAHLALGRDANRILADFAAAEQPERSPIGRRFAQFLSRTQPGPVAELARIEAAVTHVLPRCPIAHALSYEDGVTLRVKRARGAEIVRIEHDVLNHSGSKVKRAARFKHPHYLGVVRTGAEEVDLLELPVQLGEKLLEIGTQSIARSELPVEDDAFEELLAAGFLLPERYRL